MILARISRDGGTVLAGRVADGGWVLLDDLGDDPVAALATHGSEGLALLAARQVSSGAAVLDEAAVTFAVPVRTPQKVVCVALNYAEHAAEGNQDAPEEPVIFFKPPSSLLPHQGLVRNPARSDRLDYEVELGVVIGRRCANVAAADWRDVVAGYTVINDVTARDMQLVAIERNQPWDHSKAFDTFGPCGPYLVTADEIADPMDLRLSLTVDGEVRQSSSTRHMIFDVPTLVEVISRNITLEPGDLIATGTPSGIGPVASGQVMVAEVEGVGRLVNPVVYENASLGAAALTS